MSFSPRDGILFGFFMAAFGVYSILNRGLVLDSGGWGNIAAVAAGTCVLVISVVVLVRRKKKK